MIADHVASGADITMAVQRMHLTREKAKANVIVKYDNTGRITDMEAYPTNFEGEADINLNILVMSAAYLKEIVMDAIAHNYVSMTRDVFLRNLKHRNYRVYKFDGYFSCISSMSDYFRHNMELISNEEGYRELFEIESRPIYTKVRNSAPTYYGPDAKVKDSLIADGCVVEGEIENSILFRGVRVGKGAVIKNSILMQDTFVGSDSSLNCVITDKNVVIKDGRHLSGHETMPFFVGKGIMV